MAIHKNTSSAVLLLAVGWLALGCALDAGQPTPIGEFRLDDDQTLSVLSTTAPGWETWVASVVETETAVIVEVRTRNTDPLGGAGVGLGTPIWLTVRLQAPLGARQVLDGVGGKPVRAT